MKDLDFDELDRAVNSLIAKSTPNSTPSSPSTPPPPPAAPSPSPTPAPAASPRPAVAPSAPATPLANRRSPGRFMDVVRPSATPRSDQTVPERISRQGPTITPGPVAPVAVPAPPNANTSVNESPQEAPKVADWPDPLDFHGFEKGETDEDADIDEISNDIENTLGQAAEEPVDSPFLSDTKVEKRPLGAFSTSESSPPPSAPATAPDTEAAAPEVPAATYAPEQVDNVDTPLPAELQDDLLSIESDSTTDPDATPQPVAATFEEPIGPTSITQQYKEQPSTDDQKTGAIYDTDAYHKALVGPAKKKSGWLWVLWISILLIVGAGAGAAVYFYVLPLI